MIKQFQIEERDLKRLQNAIKTIDNPRIIVIINRNMKGYTIKIEGNQSDVELFIDRLETFEIIIN